MSKGWAQDTLGAISDRSGGIVRCGPFGSQLHQSDYSETGTPVIMPQDMVNGCIATAAIARVPDDHVERLSQHKLLAGDIVYARRGDIGRRAYVHEQEAGWLCGTGCLRISLPNSALNSRWLFYYLGMDHIVRSIQGRAVGATMPNINTEILRETEIIYPPRAIQDAVVSVLDAYERLIENNTRRVRILEEMATALYREWFVHFRFPSHQLIGIADSVLGKLPESWQVVAFSDACSSVADGDWIETKDQGGSDYRLLQVSNIGVGSFVETGNYRYITQETFERLRCQEVLPGDILISRMPKPIGRAWLVTSMPWRMITAVDVAIAKPHPERSTPLFLSHYLNSPEHIENSEKQATGTTRARISRSVLCATKMILPPLSLQDRFSKAVGPLYELATSLRRKNDILRQTRDLLLPKLISGEVDVSKLNLEEAVA